MGLLGVVWGWFFLRKKKNFPIVFVPWFLPSQITRQVSLPFPAGGRWLVITFNFRTCSFPSLTFLLLQNSPCLAWSFNLQYNAIFPSCIKMICQMQRKRGTNCLSCRQNRSLPEHIRMSHSYWEWWMVFFSNQTCINLHNSGLTVGKGMEQHHVHYLLLL